MSSSNKKTVVLILGPTAVGKTSFALKLAQQLDTKIISCDSRQCYQELNIGVARPTHEELKTVQHYFIASHSIQENINAGVFENYALQKVNEIFGEKDFAVMVGGTGLYANAFCNGIDEMPTVDEYIRKKIINNYNTLGLNWLQNEIKIKDEQFWNQSEQQNPQRLMRALEVFEQTGRSILTFKTQTVKKRNFEIIKIGLELPREILNHRINQRVDLMIHEGLENETKSLYEHKSLNALQTVGYKEFFDYFDGTTSKEKAIELIKTHTRQYAKRQMTWFKKDQNIHWHNPTQDFNINLYL